jgi:hypothetical protein
MRPDRPGATARQVPISRSRKLAGRGGDRSWHNHTAQVARRARSGRGLPALSAFLTSLAFVAPLAWASRAQAWASVEHQEIGRGSYLRACADLTATVASHGKPEAPEAGVKARFERVCGANLPVLARLYGDATAIAGDFLGHPSEFLSQSGAWRFHSKKSYYLLALENSAHFNPTSTRSWAEYHQQAIAYALAGAAGEGLTSVEQFQLALFESAFADHYLQDSFAAGHMGFNRAASSAAAAKSFHDAWNARGRVATDRAGHRWVTFGDGRLDNPANEEGRRHVMEAATLSVRGVLTAFVLGARVPEDEIAVWQILPFTIEAPELLADVAEVFVKEGPERATQTKTDDELVPLQLTIRPAYKDMVATASFWSVGAFSDPGDPYLALVGGLELGIPFVPAQTYLGAGGTLQAPERKRAAVIDTGLLVPLGLSVAGLVSHQLNVTASWLLGNGFAAIVHGEYQLNVELGDVLVNLHLGLAEIFPHPRTGYYGAVGLGFVFSAAGGGAF